METPPQTREGAISYISELSDERTRVTRVEVSVDNRDRALRSGQVVRAHLTRRIIKDAIMVPLLSIIPLEQGYRVYVVKENAAFARHVTTSRLIKKDAEGIDRVRVLSGLEPGDQLIVQGHRLVGDGQKVQVQKGDVTDVAGIQTQGKLSK